MSPCEKSGPPSVAENVEERVNRPAKAEKCLFSKAIGSLLAAQEFFSFWTRVTIWSRAALRARTREAARQIEPWLTNSDFRRFKWWREAERDFQPFHQRSFFSAHPDLSYTAMNGDEPLTTSPFHQDGVLQRVNLLRERMPGVEDVVMRVPPPGAGQLHLLQGCALVYTARRAAGRAISRLPMDPTWDEAGMRMELVR